MEFNDLVFKLKLPLRYILVFDIKWEQSLISYSNPHDGTAFQSSRYSASQKHHRPKLQKSAHVRCMTFPEDGTVKGSPFPPNDKELNFCVSALNILVRFSKSRSYVTTLKTPLTLFRLLIFRFMNIAPCRVQ